MPETIVLDPSEVATSRTQLDITPWVDVEGVDWGDADIAAYMADTDRGSYPVDYRVPNRTITIPLVLKTVGGTVFATARTNVQAKAALLQREGGWLKRLTSTGGTVFADVVDATLKLGGDWMQAHRNADTEAELVLQARPDFYGAEITLPDHVSGGQAQLVFTETGIQGDYPARVRVVVDEDEGQAQLGLIWGWRSRTYSSADTAALAHNGGALTPQDAATVVSTTMQHATVPALWTPVLLTDIVTTGAMNHVGTHRVWAQVEYTGFVDLGVDVRLLWGVGSLSVPVENPAQRVPGGDDAYTIDLGEVRLDPPSEGAHLWRGQIQARAATPPASFRVRKVWVVPVAEGYGVLRAPWIGSTSFNAFAARDEFNQTAGALNGKVLPVGGSWTGAGDADDFALEPVAHTLQRTANVDTFGIGRYAIAGATNYTNVVVRADVQSSDITQTTRMGVLARYTSTSLYLLAAVQFNGGSAQVRLNKNVGVGRVQVGSNLLALGPAKPNTWYSVQVTVDAAGHYQVWAWLTGGSPGDPLIVGQDSDLATGGALATGKPGLYDEFSSSSAATRAYDNFVVYVPTSDAVLHPSQSAELRWDGLYREDATGAAYGPMPDGGSSDYPRLPPAGLEGRTLEVFMRASRGDFSQWPDNEYDDISARIFYRPCWLFVN